MEEFEVAISGGFWVAIGDFWPEMVTEVRLPLLANFLRRRLLAMLGVAHVILNAHFTNMQLDVAAFARIKSAERET